MRGNKRVINDAVGRNDIAVENNRLDRSSTLILLVFQDIYQCIVEYIDTSH
jgi:hypothetical protein